MFDSFLFNTTNGKRVFVEVGKKYKFSSQLYKKMVIHSGNLLAIKNWGSKSLILHVQKEQNPNDYYGIPIHMVSDVEEL